MKRKALLMLLAAALALVLALAGCGGNVDNVEIVEWEPSEIYSDADIEAAFRTVENYFRREFKGCTLTQLYYVGDDHADEFARIADQYDSDVEAIVIFLRRRFVRRRWLAQSELDLHQMGVDPRPQQRRFVASR